MAEIILTDQTLKIITLFEGYTNVQIKDCLDHGETIYFIVEKGQLMKAIGRNGSNIKRLRNVLKKNIKVIEYSSEPETFIRNIFIEFPINDVRIEDSADGTKRIAYVSVDLRNKGKVIGRESWNLKIAREIINRHVKMDIVIV